MAIRPQFSFRLFKGVALFTVIASAVFVHVDCFIVSKYHWNPLGSTHLRASPRQRMPERTKRPGKKSSRENQNQLHRVIKSIEYYGQNEGDDQRASKELLEAMRMLSRAKTQTDVMVVRKLVDKLDVTNSESRPIQERVLKATSLSGMFSTSLGIIRNMLDASYLPSEMAYTSVCSVLRKAGRKKQLEELMHDLSKVAHRQNASIDVVAWNIYLATLCKSVEHPDDPTLAEAWQLIEEDNANEEFCVQPDLASYNTVLSTAARVGNHSLVDTIWEEMQKQVNFEPDIRAYNARLMVCDGSQRLQIFEEIQSTKGTNPDRFTINLLLCDLIKANRLEALDALMQDFIACNPEEVISAAFSAFLVTLVQNGHILSARALFDTYMAGESVAPDVRHFNVLIAGYSQLAESKSSQTDLLRQLQAGDHDTNKTVAFIEGRKLYRKMVELGISQDSYTLSSMMGLCVSSVEVVKLMENSGARLTPVVIRSAITQCGQLGDPSQACVLFDQYAAGSMNVRAWNVLLGALAAGAEKNDIVLNMTSANRCKRGSGRNGTAISTIVDGQKSSAAIRILLNAMTSSSKTSNAPFPNSQSYCIAASALQYGSPGAVMALDLFRNATNAGIPADGRFINAIFRCFGDDITEAMSSWKGEIRTACLEHEKRVVQAPGTILRSRKRNLIAAYGGLIYVSGRALRPDIAVRLVYAMSREGIEADETSLNSYRAGKRSRGELGNASDDTGINGARIWSKLLPRPNFSGLVEQYESLLYVECTKYNPNSNRMSGDRRVRIIM